MEEPDEHAGTNPASPADPPARRDRRGARLRRVALAGLRDPAVECRSRQRRELERLGPASFANPTLMMFAGQKLGYVEEGVKSRSETALRADRMAIQCPRCRRQTAWAA